MGDQNPGPGQYQPHHQAKLKRAPSFSVGSQNRVMLKSLNGNPGPGVYKNNRHPVGQNGPQYGFGSSSRIQLKQDGSPGPGSYKIPT
mmetsp:Transcript_27691/g.26714  ORF Transcript_27691/g.26714 Transcript_27691/m.26714 type:complete len:87 (-) Transcript_27691:92-352(-)